MKMVEVHDEYITKTMQVLWEETIMICTFAIGMTNDGCLTLCEVDEDGRYDVLNYANTRWILPQDREAWTQRLITGFRQCMIKELSAMLQVEVEFDKITLEDIFAMAQREKEKNR